MLKVYKVHNYVSIDGAPWREVVWSWFGPIECKTTDKELNGENMLCHTSFDEAYAYLKNSPLDGLYASETFWRCKPRIGIRYRDTCDIVYYNHFDTISYNIIYEEWKDVSLEWIVKNLSADECIQYLKERGITTCPMNF